MRQTSGNGASPSEQFTHRPNALHMIHKWSIEHPYFIIAFYFAVVALAVISVNNVIPRRFAPCFQEGPACATPDGASLRQWGES